MALMQVEEKTATNAAGVKALAADHTFDDVTVEFSPGTGGLRVPYLHLNMTDLNPRQTIVCRSNAGDGDRDRGLP
ncbi:MAG: hypothetical protein C0501_31395 [Isosphaera sp.]|nr:hypothetical protein [Isosphaera sp.]